MSDPVRRLLVATGILLFAILLVFDDLSSSNRAHELTKAPLVAVITLSNLIPCFKVLVTLSREARGRVRRIDMQSVALFLWLFVVGSLNVLILVGAAGTTPKVLGW